MKYKYALTLLSISIKSVCFSSGASFLDSVKNVKIEQLPGPAMVIDEALDDMPKYLKSSKHWNWRVKLAPWLPEVEFRYAVTERGYDIYEVVNRSIKTSGTETRSLRVSEVERESATRFEYGSEVETGEEESFGGNLQYNPDSRRNFNTDINLTQDINGETRVSGRETEQISYSEREDRGLDSYRTGEGVRDYEEYAIFATWDLSRIVFDENEVRVADVQATYHELKADLIDDIMDYYFDMLEAISFLEEVDPNSIKMQIEVAKSIAKLDGLTGGFVSFYIRHGKDL